MDFSGIWIPLVTPLRDGSVDLETGVLEPMIGPEVRAQRLFDEMLAIAR